MATNDAIDCMGNRHTSTNVNVICIYLLSKPTGLSTKQMLLSSHRFLLSVVPIFVVVGVGVGVVLAQTLKSAMIWP